MKKDFKDEIDELKRLTFLNSSLDKLKERFMLCCKNNPTKINNTGSFIDGVETDSFSVSDKFGKITITKKQRTNPLIIALYGKYTYSISALLYCFGYCDYNITCQEYQELTKII